MMRRRSRARRIAKWTGLAVCVVMAGAWAASRYWEACFYGDKLSLWVCGGGVEVRLNKWGATWFSGTWRIYPAGRDQLLIPYQYSNFSNWCVIIPLWIPLVLAAIPTVLAFMRDRRSIPGHCQHCGYDLTGNVSGRCPECGEPA